MNSLIEILNYVAEQWASAFWSILWQSTILAGVIFLITLFLRRTSASVRFWLWMLVPLRLLVMPLITISLPLLPAVTRQEIQVVQTKPVAAEIVTAGITETAYEVVPFTPENSLPTREPIIPMPVESREIAVPRVMPNLSALLMMAWLAGVLIWIVRLIYSWLKIRRIAGSATRIDKEPVLVLAQKAATMVGLKRLPNIFITTKGVSPFLFGVIRPVLVVPAGFVNGVCDEGLSAVFAHEFAHLRRRDTIIGWILAICETVYFFNPVFHIVKRRILFERERACDDWVVAAGNSRKSVYANALINAADICRDFSQKLGPVGVVAESFGDLKKRLIAIGSSLKPKTRLSNTALILLILMGIICAPGLALTNRTNAGLTNEVNETVIRTSSSSVEDMKEVISGIVEDEDGDPINGASVELLNRELALVKGPIGGIEGILRSVMQKDGLYCHTGSDGYFELVELYAGETDIIIKAENYQTKILRDVSTGTKDLKIVLSEPGSYMLSGEVVDGDGNPVSDVKITLARDEGEVITSIVQTDASGLFQFDDILEPIALGTRILIARKEEFGVWGKTLDTTGYETYVKITLLPEKTVSGRVVDDANNPIVGAKVLLSAYHSGFRDTGFSFRISFRKWQDIAPSAITDTKGQFVLTALPMRRVVNLSVYAEGYTSDGMEIIDTGSFDEGYAIGLKTGAPKFSYGGRSVEMDEEIEFVLQRVATLRGTVTYEDTGLPAQGIKVKTQPNRTQPNSIPRGTYDVAETTTDDKGRFELVNVSPQPSNLLVMFEDLERGTLPEWTAAALELYDIEPGEIIDDITLVLVKGGGGIIRGKVTDSEGNPLHGIDIYFYSAARPRSGSANHGTRTVEDGSWAYRFPPGEVYVYVGISQLIDFLPGANWSRRNYTMNLEAGQEIENIDFTLNQEVAENSPYR